MKNTPPIEEILNEIKKMIDNGASSFQVDAELDKYALSPDERSLLVTISQEYQIEHINTSLERERKFIQKVLLGITLIAILLIIVSSGSISNFFKDLRSPVSLVLIYFGYRVYKKNRNIVDN